MKPLKHLAVRHTLASTVAGSALEFSSTTWAIKQKSGLGHDKTVCVTSASRTPDTNMLERLYVPCGFLRA